MWTRRSMAVLQRSNGRRGRPRPRAASRSRCRRRADRERRGEVALRSPTPIPPNDHPDGRNRKRPHPLYKPNQCREAGGQVSGCQGNVGDAACATSGFLTMQQVAPLWRSKTVARLNPARLPRPFFLKRRKPGSGDQRAGWRPRRSAADPFSVVLLCRAACSSRCLLSPLVEAIPPRSSRIPAPTASAGAIPATAPGRQRPRQDHRVRPADAHR